MSIVPKSETPLPSILGPEAAVPLEASRIRGDQSLRLSRANDNSYRHQITTNYTAPTRFLTAVVFP